MKQPYKDFTSVKGVNNRFDPTQLRDNYLVEASNIDIDDNGLISRRKGYTTIGTSTNSHSLWSNGKYTYVASFRTPTYTLDYFDASTDTYTTILTLDDTEFLQAWSYTSLPDGRVFATNGVRVGYLEKATWSRLETPSGTYKIPIKPGHLCTYFNGRVYVARGNTVWVSDVFRYGQVDGRYGFLQLGNYITLLEGMSGGIFIADGNVNFLKGLDLPELELTPLLEYNAIQGTAVRVDGGMIVGGKNYTGTNIIFMTERGLCLGTDSGELIELTHKKYVVPSCKKGASCYRVNDRNIAQTITVLQN